MFRGKARVVGKIRRPVVGVKVQQNTAPLQHPVPFPVSPRRVRQRPGQISGNHQVKRFIRKIQFLRVHHPEPAGNLLLPGQLFRSHHHLRGQVASHHLMACPCQQHGEKSGSAAHVQNLQRPVPGHLPANFRKPPVCHGAVQLPLLLFQKAVAAFSPVFGDPLLSVVIRFPDPSVGDHGPVLQYLQGTGLIQNHPIVFCPADLQGIPLIIPHTAQIFPLLDHIPRHLCRIPQPGMGGGLIADIGHVQRIIRSVILLAQINTQTAENIPHIPAHGADFLRTPVPHAAPFDEDAGDSRGSRVIVSAARGHVGADHVRHVHLLGHFPGSLHHFGCRLARVVNIGGKLFIIIPAVQVDVIIRCPKQFPHHGVRQLPGSASRRISGEYPVQVFPVLQHHAARPLLKGRPVYHLYDHHCTGHLFNFQFLSQLHRRLDTHILPAVNAGGDQHRFSRPRSVEDRRRQKKFSFCQCQLPLHPFPRGRRQPAKGKGLPFPVVSHCICHFCPNLSVFLRPVTINMGVEA